MTFSLWTYNMEVEGLDFQHVIDMLQGTPWPIRENNSAKSPQELWDNVNFMR